VSTEIRYCSTGCTNKGNRITTEARSNLCAHCEDRLHQWLRKIPDHYALLPTFLEHGTTDRNPESKTSKAPDPPAPMRLDIIDLLDTRLGRIWNGTAPAHDRRGVLGTLRAHAERIIDERHLTTKVPETVTTACALLDRHRLWTAEQDWIRELYTEVKQLHRTLSDAVGDYRRPPVGRCHVDTDQGTRCNGNLHANPYGGVRCARCQATWDATHLRQLGLAQAAVGEPA